ncbi:hypothetical protein F-VV10_0028 [Faustovirus]|nr:hypothetical protein F-VV10_0028 [Faustovirus]
MQNFNVLTVGNDATRFDYLWYNGCIYVPEVIGGCPQYKTTFIRYVANIKDLDVNINKFRLLGSATLSNTIDEVLVCAGSTIVIGSALSGYRATLIVNSDITISTNHSLGKPIYSTTNYTIGTILEFCIKNYNQDLIGKSYFKKQIREYADKALEKLTVAFIMISAGVILLSSYYNVYKIFTQR